MLQARTPSDDHALQRIAVPRYGDAARQVLPIAILFLACILLALMLRAGPAQGETAPVSLPETIAVEDIPALFPGLDIEIAQEALTHYRFGRIAEGDALRDAITDEAADALLEWSAVRSSEMRDFARIAAFLRAHLRLVVAAACLRLRAEQAFVGNGPRAASDVLAFLPAIGRAAHRPRACLLPRPCGDRCARACRPSILARRVLRVRAPGPRLPRSQFLILSPRPVAGDSPRSHGRPPFCRGWIGSRSCGRFGGRFRLCGRRTPAAADARSPVGLDCRPGGGCRPALPQ